MFYAKSTGRVACKGTYILKPKDLHVQVAFIHKTVSLLTLTVPSSMTLNELCESVWPILTVICTKCKCTHIRDDELLTHLQLCIANLKRNIPSSSSTSHIVHFSVIM